MDESQERDAQAGSSNLEGRLRDVGSNLGTAFRAVLGELPGAPHRPSQLATELSVNRAVASKILNATAKEDPLEVLHLIPGPEPLRKVLRASGNMGVSLEARQAATAAIERFDRLIRNEAGNRSALDALISSSLPGARERFEMASKYSVFKGLAQLKGVQAEHWLCTAILSPSKEDKTKHDLTWLNGAVAMQRLRPAVTVRFSYRHGRTGGVFPPEDGMLPALGVLPLEQFCVNPPAKLESRTAGDTIHYTLPTDLLGAQELVDMFVVDHHPASLCRHSPGPKGRRTSLFAEPTIPVANLTFDVILHKSVFPGRDPELITYDTGYDGLADVNDPARDIDRIELEESIEALGPDMTKYEISGIHTYGKMLAHLCDRFGWEPRDFRAYRTQIAYPVHGWQVCLAFEPPLDKQVPGL